MKLTQNKIEEVVLEILGSDCLRLVNTLKDKENISEFLLANRLKKDIKVIRHLLYKLHNYNLVLSTRKKDKQKGWYIYYWTLIPDNIKFLYLKNKRKNLDKLKEQLQKERVEQFYACPKKCVRLDFDQSLDFEFRCPECGELISLDQDPNQLSELQKKIKEIEEEINEEEFLTKKKVRKEVKEIKKRSKIKNKVLKIKRKK